MSTRQKKCYGYGPKDIHILRARLNNKKMGWEEKLLALIGLAHIASNESVEILQKYYRNPGSEMKVYAKLALDEAKHLAKGGANEKYTS